MRRPVLAAIAAVSLMSVSSAAVAQSAAPLSLAHVFRAGPESQEASDLRGGFIIPTLVVLGLGALIYFLTKDDSPSSP